MSDNPETTSPAKVQCTAAKDPAVRLFIIAAMAIGAAIWCWSDRRPYPEVWDFKHINDVAAYLLNNWGPFLFAPAAIVVALLAIRHLMLRAEANDEGITLRNKTLRWPEITRIDASELKKGTVVLETSDGSQMKLHSWKLRNFKELIAFVESKLPDVERVAPE